MAVSANALTSVNSLRAYMRTPPVDTEMMSIYNDESDSATAATVQVLSTGIRLIVTTGANAGTTTYPFATSTTITTIVAAINVADKGWVATVIGPGSQASADLNVLAVTDAFGLAATQYLKGLDTYHFEQAIDAVSDAFELHCSRTFASASYKHRFHGSGGPRMRLRQLPVTAVAAIAVGTRGALKVRNTTTDAQRATVTNDRTSLTFTIYGGTSDTRASAQTVTLATDTTMALVITAINALGNGWEAATLGATENAWKSADLLIIQPWNVLKEWHELPIPDEWIDDYILTGGTGIIERGFAQVSYSPRTFMLDHGNRNGFNPTSPAYPNNPGGHPGNHWPHGVFTTYVEYTAGYATTPDDIEQLCNEGASNMIRGGSHDKDLSATSAPDFNESYRGEGWFTPEIKKGLARHRLVNPPAYMEA